jgi:hypothetical protein
MSSRLKIKSKEAFKAVFGGLGGPLADEMELEVIKFIHFGDVADSGLDCSRCADKLSRVCEGRGLSGAMVVEECLKEKSHKMEYGVFGL